ncbi:glycoside hydrolase family 2 protein [Flavihumibacter sp. UBA7668]|uniref:glycoside hydrolase family 2 protein n=1 Tax=Flavihumibacter sp. UBA7668 TaxID=1946542 RepID=UPI0025C1D054|nr:glycoside hydrolase family 2 TIM barrel-domain containing protein [Flavihumibacter sp. UBA7668]
MKYLYILLGLILCNHTYAQKAYELNNGWKCAPVSQVQEDGKLISAPDYVLNNWEPAVVPGTVLTTMLENGKVPDPFIGMNNTRIPDIYHTGGAYYTYWFVKDFTEKIAVGENVWLHLRGVNYSCDVFVNGQKLNRERHHGMFLRQSYNISKYIKSDGKNRLAVIVYPPAEPGNPNGGQGGDGTIAKNVAHQYVAGWDWIQPIRDRNTGIWDKVLIEKTGSVNIQNPHIVTLVPGKRMPDSDQQPATLKVAAELNNSSSSSVSGQLRYSINGKTITKTVVLKPNAVTEIKLPDHQIMHPKLWWPNGYGEQYLYPLKIEFISAGRVSDEEHLQVGVREIKADWNSTTRSKQIWVNGQPVFIKGANWIISDAMLRFSKERYNAEIRFHRDMNLNLIRIWGGAISERPEFYEACDKYGLLVMQDFWGSGDCNGRWVDPMKKDDQWTRRNYPDDHKLFLTSAADQIKMIRNYASLAMWCGGNEITLPQDIQTPLRDSILPTLDGTRWFVDYSNSDDMSFNFLGGNGDGPYGIQQLKTFFNHRTWPFNSEIGSVGTGDYQSLERFLPNENMVPPDYTAETRKEIVDSVWQYHKYIGYNNHINAYGKTADLKEWARKAQLVNYDQYRSLMEGFSSRMWEWYTGVIIWKTQNPWTALRGQMYDYYLDPNACLYGLRKGSAPINFFFNHADTSLHLINNTFIHQYDLMLVMSLYDKDGKEKSLGQVFAEIGPSTSRIVTHLNRQIREATKEEGAFLSLRILNLKKEIVSDNLYWLPDAEGNYSGLSRMPKADAQINARLVGTGKIEVSITAPAGGPISFFNRYSLVDPATKKRLLPVFYEDNYVSVLPGQTKKILLEFTEAGNKMPLVAVEGWNQGEQFIEVKR